MPHFTYECNEQPITEYQKYSVFHTTVTYVTVILQIKFEMDKQNTENNDSHLKSINISFFL